MKQLAAFACVTRLKIRSVHPLHCVPTLTLGYKQYSCVYYSRWHAHEQFDNYRMMRHGSVERSLCNAPQ